MKDGVGGTSIKSLKNLKKINDFILTEGRCRGVVPFRSLLKDGVGGTSIKSLKKIKKINDCILTEGRCRGVVPLRVHTKED